MRLHRWLAGALLASAAAWAVVGARESQLPLRDKWSAAELDTLASLRLAADGIRKPGSWPR